MDQLKPILQNLWTQRFWVSCGLVAVLTLVVSFLATGAVRTQTEKYVGEIKSSFTNTNGLAGVNPVDGLTAVPDSLKSTSAVSFPNQTTLAEMDRITDEAKVAARVAWEYQYDQQRRLLVFPSTLQEPVRNAFRTFLPIESKLPKFNEIKSDQEVRIEYRMAYGEFIQKRLPQLAELIGARWAPGSSAAGGGMMGGMMGGMSGSMMGGGMRGSSPSSPSSPMGSFGSGGPSSPMGSGGGSVPGGSVGGGAAEVAAAGPSIVNWNGGNQGLWESKTTVFNGRNGNKSPTNVPTTHQVMYLQEDLWVLEAIFSVIKKVNGDADANDLADLKQIDHILVGAEAGEIGENASLDAGGGGGGGSGGLPYDPDMMKSMMGNIMGGGGSSSSAADEKAASSDDPAHLRYVDRDFKPLTADDFHAALTATGPDKAYLQVAKRIPVRLGFRMKEDSLLKLLAECANSNPPIEVRQVRINRHTASSSAGATGRQSRGGAAASGFGPAAAASGGGGSANATIDGAGGGGAAAAQDDSSTATDVVGIEIYGIVYIYNPVPADTDATNILKLANPPAPATPTADRSPPVPTVTQG